ncbi:MAG: FkbM family methyltransferase [Candidatus Kapaibacterium sp.]
MKQLLKSYLAKVLSLADAFPSRMTDPANVAGLIHRLHPLATDKPLIRFGPDEDGGYLIPDDLEGVAACFSPGVSLVSGFEKDCAERGIPVFLADKSVDVPAEEHELFHFTKKFIGAYSDENFMTLDEWIGESLEDKNSDLMLQIDIEGYEFEAFLSASADLMKRFRIIVAEFHRLDLLWSEPFFKIANHTFEKLLNTHSCVHIHPNNCCGSLKQKGMEIPIALEFTFLRNDRIVSSSYQTEFPHPLDYDNMNMPPMILPKCWHR